MFSIHVMYFIEDFVQSMKLHLSQIVVLLGEMLTDFIQETSRLYWARRPLAESIFTLLRSVGVQMATLMEEFTSVCDIF